MADRLRSHPRPSIGGHAPRGPLSAIFSPSRELVSEWTSRVVRRELARGCLAGPRTRGRLDLRGTSATGPGPGRLEVAGGHLSAGTHRPRSRGGPPDCRRSPRGSARSPQPVGARPHRRDQGPGPPLSPPGRIDPHRDQLDTGVSLADGPDQTYPLFTPVCQPLLLVGGWYGPLPPGRLRERWLIRPGGAEPLREVCPGGHPDIAVTGPIGPGDREHLENRLVLPHPWRPTWPDRSLPAGHLGITCC